MDNPRSLILTECVIEKIWWYNGQAEVKVFWCYISYLLKKLSALQANVQIKATRNAGYSLDDLS